MATGVRAGAGFSSGSGSQLSMLTFTLSPTLPDSTSGGAGFGARAVALRLTALVRLVVCAFCISFNSCFERWTICFDCLFLEGRAGQPSEVAVCMPVQLGHLSVLKSGYSLAPPRRACRPCVRPNHMRNIDLAGSIPSCHGSASIFCIG